MLVGRNVECLGIAEVLGQVRVGRGTVLLVTGSPGLGKTALLEYAADAAAGMRVLRATGAEFEQRFAWAALHQLLHPVLEHLDGLPDEQAAALRGALRLGRSTGDDPYLVSLGVLTLLSQLAEDAGLVCLIDDAQWLDDQSADALRFAARRLAQDPVGVLVAAREVPADRFGLDRWPRLNLAALSAPEMTELLGRRAGVAVAGGVAQRLLGYADGNPLALVEMVGALTAEQLTGELPLPDPLPLGPGLTAAFLDQVHRLTVDAQDLLLVAACGQGARWNQVLAAAQRLNVPDRAEELERSGLVAIEASAVRFRHPMVRSAVLAATPFTRRRVVHLAIAQVLVGDEHADQRTWHRAAACPGTDAEVADELAASAKRARARSGFAAAAAASQRAAELSPDATVRARRLVEAGEAALAAGQPEWALACVGRAAQGAGERAVSGRVAAVRGYTQLRAGLLSQAVGTLRDGAGLLADSDPTAALEMLSAASEAAGLAGEVGGVLAVADQARTVATAPSGAQPLSDLLSGIADILSGRPEHGSATVGAAVDQLAGSGNVRWLIWAVYGATYQGDMGRAVQLIDAAARRARASGALDNLPLLLHGVAMAEAIRGRYPDAEAAAAEGLRLARETGQRTSECLNLAVLASITATRGEENRCREYADAALALAIPHGITLAAAWASWALSVLDLGAGRPDEALSRLRSLTRPGAPTGHFLVTRSTTPDLVEAAVRCGDTETAQRATTWLQATVARSPATPASGARLARCQGLMAAEPVQAVGYLREALRLYDLGKERFGRARTELLLGEALRRAKRRTEAREALRSALTVFDALGARVWAEQARRELRALGEAPARALSGGLGVLTPQELQVSRLVAAGASNREIAAQLFLSARTVEYHLYKAYPKLGIGSRTELARLVLTADAAKDGRP